MIDSFLASFSTHTPQMEKDRKIKPMLKVLSGKAQQRFQLISNRKITTTCRLMLCEY